MFLDKLLEFDPTGTAITVTAVSTNVLDMANQRDMGIGEPGLDVVVVVTTAFTAAGAATLTTSFQSAPDNAGVPGAWTDQVLTGAIGKAALTVGAEVLRIALPKQQSAAAAIIPRYYRLNYTVATGPFTAGAVYAGLTLNKGRQANVSYPNNFSITGA